MKSIVPKQLVEPLLAYFDRLMPLTAEEKELVVASFQPRLFRKRQYLLQAGNMASHFYFVESGCFRVYKFDEKGTTHIIQFAPENYWVMDISSCHGLRPSVLNIDALEDSVVWQISRDDLLALFLKAPKFDRIFRVLIENSYARLQERLLETISSTAEERYRAFQQTYPQLLHRLPQVQIASCLGITPEFLSRLKKRRLSAGTP